MYRAMASAGFEQFAISVEHGDQDFLTEVTKKRLDYSEVLATCQIAHDEGLLVHANFMMGFSFETKILRERLLILSERWMLTAILFLSLTLYQEHLFGIWLKKTTFSFTTLK